MTVILGLFIIMVGFLSVIVNRKHILMILMSLEMMILGLFMILLLQSLESEIYEEVIFFLVMVVIEACLSLSMMVILVCFYGSDLVNSLKIFSI